MSKANTNAIREKFLAIEEEMNKYLYERTDPIRGLSLGILSSSNVLLLGPPGTAKSMVVREWTKRILNAQYFEWLITRFSTPEELLGPISFEGLKNDRHMRVTAHKLPEANLAFLDEIFKGNAGILNSLLTIMNERIFFNGPHPQKIPLYTVIGSSNEIPDEEDGLDALYDRFHLKFEVKHIQEDSNFVSMLIKPIPEPEITLTQQDILAAQADIENITSDETIDNKMVEVSRYLRNQGIIVSDRTYKQARQILKAEAWLNGHSEIQEEDIEVLKHVLWHDPDERRKTESTILEMVNPEKNKVITLFDEAFRIANDVASKQGAERQQKAIEVIAKVRKAKQDITKIITDLQRVKRDTKSIEPYLNKLNKMLTDLQLKEIGVIQI